LAKTWTKVRWHVFYAHGVRDVIKFYLHVIQPRSVCMRNNLIRSIAKPHSFGNATLSPRTFWTTSTYITLEPQAKSYSRIRHQIFVHRKSTKKNLRVAESATKFCPPKIRIFEFFSFYLEKITSMTASNIVLLLVLTFQQLWLCLNSLLHAFSAELLTVLTCDNFSNPDISRKRSHSAIILLTRISAKNSHHPSGLKKNWTGGLTYITCIANYAASSLRYACFWTTGNVSPTCAQISKAKAMDGRPIQLCASRWQNADSGSHRPNQISK